MKSSIFQQQAINFTATVLAKIQQNNARVRDEIKTMEHKIFSLLEAFIEDHNKRKLENDNTSTPPSESANSITAPSLEAYF